MLSPVPAQGPICCRVAVVPTVRPALLRLYAQAGRPCLPRNRNEFCRNGLAGKNHSPYRDDQTMRGRARKARYPGSNSHLSQFNVELLQ